MMNFMQDNKEEDKKSTVADDFKTGETMGRKDREHEEGEEKKVADTKHDTKSS